MIAEVVGHAAADSCHDDTTQVGQYGLDGEVGGDQAAAAE